MSRGVADSFACAWGPFSPTGLPCPALTWFVPSPIIFCYTCHVQLISLGDLFFSEEKQEEWIRGRGEVGRALGSVEGGETAIGVYYMRGEYILKIKKIQSPTVIAATPHLLHSLLLSWIMVAGMARGRLIQIFFSLLGLRWLRTLIINLQNLSCITIPVKVHQRQICTYI